MDEADRAQAVGDMWLAHHLRLARTVGDVGCGICRDCGDPIPDRRRQVMPGAARCVECQAVREGGGP